MSRMPFLTAAAAAAALLAAPAAAPAQSLTSELDRLAKSSKVAVAVVDAKSGRTLYAKRATAKRPLASTTKLLTSLAALNRLGGRGGTLKTTVLATGPVDATGTLHGNLVLHGDGDPTFGTAQAFGLADQVFAAGVRRITGAVIADESLFDTVRGGPSTGGGFDPELRAPLSALSYDLGQQTPGGPVSADPLPLAAAKFDDKLEAKGILLPNRPGTTTTPLPGTPIASVPSPMMAELVKTMLAESEDFFAEMLTKRVAATAGVVPATTAAGAKLVQRSGTTLVDGSGLARQDTGSARAVVATLRALRKAGAESLLARAGTGTLRGRLTGLSCRAKTGTLSGVSNLAGLCTTKRSRRKVAFAVFGSSQAQVDRIAAAIVRRG